jgi:hypothetical protein
MKRLIRKAGKLKGIVKKFIDSNKESILIVLKDNFNRDFLLRLKKGEFLISEKLIKIHIEKEIQKEEDVELLDVYCTPEGLRVSLIAEKYMAKVKVDFCIYIKNIKITSKRQIIIFSLKNEKIIGDNLSGMILSAFTETLLAGIITKAVFPEDILKSVHYKSDHTAAIIELKDVDFIQKLNKPLFKTSKTPFDLISIVGAKHTYNGIKVKVKAMNFPAKKRNI